MNMEFKYAPMFQLGPDTTEYYRLTGDHVSMGSFEGKPMLKVDAEGWKKELAMIKEHYAKFGDRLPAALEAQLKGLEARLG